MEKNKNKAILEYRHSKSWHGLPIDQLKSHMQKAIRRGNFDEASKAFASMANMLDLFRGETLAKAIRTNAINRIVICALEDVGVAAPSVVMDVLRRLLPMTKQGKRVEFVMDIALACIKALCSAPKTRVMSHLYHAYGVATNRAQALALHLPVEQVVDFATYPLDNPNILQCWDAKQADEVMQRLFEEQGKRLGECKDGEKTKLDPRNQNAMHWAWRLSEQRPVLQFFVALVHFDLRVEPCDSWPVVSEKLVTTLEEHEFDLEIWAEALDVHTAAGRQAGKNATNFRNEGAIVTNEDPRFADSRLLQIYLQSKK
jgi:hypothetical protein